MVEKHMVDVYLDLPLVGATLGLIQDATLLWMVAQICGLKPKFMRFLAGGALGGIFQFFLLINQETEGLIYSWIVTPLLFMFLIPTLMVALTFLPLPGKKFLSVLGYFYGLAFFLSGFHWGLDMVNRRFWGGEISFLQHFALHVTLIFILGEIGWGVVHRKIWERLCLYKIRIELAGRHISAIALLDTGNRLCDPLTKAPVLLLELERIKTTLPIEVSIWVERMLRGEMEDIEKLPQYWQERMRILPFNSIGKEHGLLIGFRPDAVGISQNGQETIHHHAIVAFYNRKLSPEGAFQALIPPELIRE